MRSLLAIPLALSLTAPSYAAEKIYFVPEPSEAYELGAGVGTLLGNWVNALAQKRLRADIDATYAVCEDAGEVDGSLRAAADKLLRYADNYSGELSLRLSAMGLQCRVGADENDTLANLPADAVEALKAKLARDEDFSNMVDNHTTNGTTLDMASNALLRIHASQAKLTEMYSNTAQDRSHAIRTRRLPVI